MISETRIDEVADQLIDLEEVIVVTTRVARAVAERFPSGLIEPSSLRQTIRELDAEGKIEIVDFDDGEMALE